MRHITPLCVVLIFVSLSVQAQSKPVCSLLTAADISAVGATGQGTPGEVPTTTGSAKGATMKMCSWRMKAGGLNLSANPMPPGASRAAIEAQLTSTYQMSHQKGGSRTKKTSATCHALSSRLPQGRKTLQLTPAA